MNESLKRVEQELSALSDADFDLNNEQADGIERLNDLTSELLLMAQPQQAAQLILHTMERLAESDLGSPGPLVHTLEQLPDYESHLVESIARKPTSLSLWALNRVINVTTEQKKKEKLLLLMQHAITHPLASKKTKEEAERFLHFQGRA